MHVLAGTCSSSVKIRVETKSTHKQIFSIFDIKYCCQPFILFSECIILFLIFNCASYLLFYVTLHIKCINAEYYLTTSARSHISLLII